MSVLHHLCQSLICQRQLYGMRCPKIPAYTFRSGRGFLPSLYKFLILNEMPSARLWLPLKTQTFLLPAICIPKTGSIRPCQGSFCSPKIGIRANGVHGSPVRPTSFRVVVYPIRCLSPVFFHKFSEHLRKQTSQHHPPPGSLIPGSLLTTSSSLCSACDAPQHGLKLVEVQIPRAASARRRSMQHQQSQSICKFTTCHFVVNSLLVNSRSLGCYFCCPVFQIAV